VFEELAAGAVAAGQPASVIVISVDPTMLRPSLISSWVGRIRAEIRGGDFAGTLSDREIAVLLCDASAEQAAIVCARLQQMLAVDDTTGMFHTAIGITTRSPDSPFEGSLIGAARAGAAAIH
jgi:GGDEF domain-containing protein